MNGRPVETKSGAALAAWRLHIVRSGVGVGSPRGPSGSRPALRTASPVLPRSLPISSPALPTWSLKSVPSMPRDGLLRCRSSRRDRCAWLRPSIGLLPFGRGRLGWRPSPSLFRSGRYGLRLRAVGIDRIPSSCGSRARSGPMTPGLRLSRRNCATAPGPTGMGSVGLTPW